MRNTPVIKTLSIPRSPKGYPKVALTFQVEAGLEYIRGNSAPYFTLTYTEHRKGFPNQCYSGGAGHDRILHFYPRLADLAAMHLSDINGVPMHAEANGWYSLAGALPDAAGQQYHAGNSQRHFPKAAIDPLKPWDTTDYRNPTPDECLQIFADHARVDLQTARHVLAMVIQASAVKAAMVSTPYDWAAGRQWYAQWIEEQRPRWKAEAEATIAKYGLKVFGDEWPVAG